MTELSDSRRQKDEFFKFSPQSPIPPGERRHFEGLAYFDANPDLSFSLEVEPADGAEIVVQTSDGVERTYRRAGTVEFEVNGAPVRLTLYDTGGHAWFLPFRDATSGSSTYGAGRYLDLHDEGGGKVTLDFNLAYHPFCAYNDAYSCPLPPHENWLQVSIEAGERL